MSRPSRDWDAVFYEYATWSPAERTLGNLAKHLGVPLSTIKRQAARHRWQARLRAMDERARKEREKKAIRKFNERAEDDIRIVEAGRMRYAQRLRDPSYQITGQEFFALAKLELLIEGRDTQKIGIGSISEEFREMIRQLPVYTQERVLAAVLTGVPYHEVLEIDEAMVTEEDDDGPAD